MYDKLRTSTEQAPHKYRTSSSVINLNPDSKFYTDNEEYLLTVRGLALYRELMNE